MLFGTQGTQQTQYLNEYVCNKKKTASHTTHRVYVIKDGIDSATDDALLILAATHGVCLATGCLSIGKYCA